MSENLKRAESLFNRIMNQNGDKETQFKSSIKQNGREHAREHAREHREYGNGSEHGSHRQHNHHSNGSHGHGGGHGGSNYHGHGHGGRYKHKTELLNHEALKLPDQILKDIDKQVLITKQDQHILPYCWTIWHHFRYTNGPITNLSKKKHEDKVNYLQMTKEVEFPKFGNPQELIKNFASVEQMWMNISILGKSKDVAVGTEYFVFKSGINPAWEDPFNTKGGRWIFKFIRKGNDDEEFIRTRTNLIWERLILRILTGTLVSKQEYNDELIEYILSDINGIVLSIRKDEDIISLWNSNMNRSRKFSNIPTRRILCDSILRIIKECDLILLGGSIFNTCESLSERIRGVSFEYRLHDHTYDKFRKYRKEETDLETQDTRHKTLDRPDRHRRMSDTPSA